MPTRVRVRVRVRIKLRVRVRPLSPSQLLLRPLKICAVVADITHYDVAAPLLIN